MQKGGYIIVYALILVSVLLIITTSVSQSAISEFYTNRDLLGSAIAINAADSAVECLLNHDAQFTAYYPFDTTSPVSSVKCYYIKSDGTIGSLAPFSVGNVDGISPAPLNCYDKNYTPVPLTLGSPDGPCAKVTIEVISTPVPGFFTAQCDVKINADGYDNCSAPTVQRGRWTDLVPKPGLP